MKNDNVFNVLTPKNDTELMQLAKNIEGLTFLQLSHCIGRAIPDHPTQRKGWVGHAIEFALGADAGTRQAPDFSELQIELKTIPLNRQRNPTETTFVTNISLTSIYQESWYTSACYAKLRRILWIPVEGDQHIDFYQRRIGRAQLWSPDEEIEQTLKTDWEELTNMIVTGRLEDIHAGLGEYLQIRPKAANARAICSGYDGEGRLIQTLPRGFYLRSKLTKQIFLNFN